ncbi:hypothetical protein RvY_11156 [Ramazzottius varieornatus]|uniref:BTB domain-containing protein n=1 Tax=Ramazzottius varieornatus TaxID=947166 RepID=A0A1D1VF85_RAMVA|nr:hypothetical protein RvY_11156 [Ramazzottius varieornatus]
MADNAGNQVDVAWQSGITSTTSMLESFFLKTEFCDVVFRVGPDGQREDMKAHRALLAARSPVFAAMFFGSLPEKNIVVEVTDTMPDIFKLMLKYVYSDKTLHITPNNVIGIYDVAHKYDIVPLKSICAESDRTCISME